MSSRYYVFREKTLVYQQDHWPWRSFYGVLAGKLVDGGHDPKNGVVCINDQDLKDLRLAMPDDFHDFRVSPKGYFPETALDVS